MAGKRRDGTTTGYTREELIEKLQDFLIEEGKVPTSRDADRGTHGLPCARVYARVFGSFSEAIRALGLPVDGRGGHNRRRTTPDGARPKARKKVRARMASTKEG